MLSQGRSESLSERDLRVIQECLNAAAGGPFFPNWEFETLFGLTRAEVAAVAAAWPAVDESAEEVRRAVIGALGHLTGYLHGEEDAWGRYISVPPSDVIDVLRRWRISAAGRGPLRVELVSWFSVLLGVERLKSGVRIIKPAWVSPAASSPTGDLSESGTAKNLADAIEVTLRAMRRRRR